MRSNSSSVCTKVAPAPPKVKRPSHKGGNQIPEQFLTCKKLFCYSRRGHWYIYLFHQLAELISILSNVYGINIYTNNFHIMLFPNTLLIASIHRFKAVCPPMVGSTASISGCILRILLCSQRLGLQINII